MAQELFSNNAITTLNGSINNSTNTVVVTSASGFPTSGNFRIKIDDEILLVTSVSSNTFTATRGVESTTAASHSDDATVSHVVTAASLRNATKEVGTSLTVSGTDAFAVGNGCTASGNYSQALGKDCTASAEYSFAQGWQAVGNILGGHTEASGVASGWSAGDVQRHDVSMYVGTTTTSLTALKNGSNDYLAITSAAGKVRTWFMQIQVLAVNGYGNVSTWRFVVTYQHYDGTTGEYIHIRSPSGSTYSPFADISPNDGVTEVSGYVRFNKSSENFNISVTASSSEVPCRWHADIHITELYGPYEEGGYS